MLKNRWSTNQGSYSQRADIDRALCMQIEDSRSPCAHVSAALEERLAEVFEIGETIKPSML
ncbi:hypothetical protein DM02DRAFT_609620 [Periconia macrospinosa]|uniref:Uncharacterized protein n=1 Tax=Periconia macrospinosa TaxID=97972 RepID=A0A2V1E8X2_9PLEO|nr:hypothetical protein DM02DRAFT_609620 [Periconia macrospinosa]